MTAIRLVPIAWRIGIPKCSARMGVSRTPPPMPVSAPSNPAKKPSTTRSALSIAALHHPRGGGGFSLFVRVITRAHHGAGFDVAEAEAKGCFTQFAEFLGRVEARDGQMIARRAQILPDGKNVDAAAAEIAEYFDQFVRRFAEADHDAALCHHAGREFLGVIEQRESALVARSGANRAVEARDRFSIVIQNVG